MQECETSTESSYVKRVSVRTGGAGHAHSGVVKADRVLATEEGIGSPKVANGKMVRLGR